MTDAELDRIVRRLRPAGWAPLRPALARLGQPDAGAHAVAGWLEAAGGGSRHEAARALRAMAMQPWSLVEADGGFVLGAGDRTWRLVPVPALQPQLWHVTALPA